MARAQPTPARPSAANIGPGNRPRSYKPPASEREITQYTAYTVPGTQPGEDPILYWTALGSALKQFKPPAADAGELKLLARGGIAPGHSPANDPRLGPGLLAGLRAAVALGPQ